MALEDFYGEYQVEVSCSMNFGNFSVVHIQAGDTSDAEITITPSNVDFSGLDAARTQTFPAVYDPAMEELRIDWRVEGGEAHDMLISRYFDGLENYKVIYGAVRMKLTGEQGRILHAPNWAARAASNLSAEGNPAAGNEGSRPAIAAVEDFYGSYIVRSTANAQFGTLSTIEIGDQNGVTTLRIRNAGGQEVGRVSMALDEETVSLQGDLLLANPGETAIIAVSLSAERGTDIERVIYGSVAVDDPEQGGTYVAEDEGDDPDPPSA